MIAGTDAAQSGFPRCSAEATEVPQHLVPSVQHQRGHVRPVGADARCSVRPRWRSTQARACSSARGPERSWRCVSFRGSPIDGRSRCAGAPPTAEAHRSSPTPRSRWSPGIVYTRVSSVAPEHLRRLHPGLGDGPSTTLYGHSAPMAQRAAVARSRGRQSLRARRWRARRRAGSSPAICSAKLLRATSPYRATRPSTSERARKAMYSSRVCTGA